MPMDEQFMKECLNKAVTLAPNIGDFWALYYKFELQHGSEENHKNAAG